MVSKPIALEGAANIRDFAGYRSVEGRTVAPGQFLRGDSPDSLSTEDRQRLLRHGVRRVVDLRGSEEVTMRPNPFADEPSVRYFHIDMYAAVPAKLFFRVTPRSLSDLYIDLARYAAEAVAAVFRVMSDERDGAVLFHCTAGKDRTGIIAALLLSVLDVDRSTIVDDYSVSRGYLDSVLYRIESTMPSSWDRATRESILASTPDYIEYFLEFIDETWNGAEAYLLASGLEPAALSALRRKAFAPQRFS
ncbi:MAG: tyrosine-protein phosphatase [Spirochaetales bacterium]